MSTVYNQSGEKIEVVLRRSLMRVYLSRIGGESLQTLSYKQKQVLFLMLISDFLRGKLHLDELSEFAHLMWDPSLLQENEDAKQLVSALQSASELNFYVRNVPEIDDDPKGSLLIGFLMDVLSYYKMHKSIL